MTAWRCCLASALAVLLAACAGTPGSRPPAHAAAAIDDRQAPACRAYVAARVAHFRAHVGELSRRQDQGPEATAESPALAVARTALVRAGLDEADCLLPYCIVRPLANGRLDSYCGYREPDPSGAELYRWVPYR